MNTKQEQGIKEKEEAVEKPVGEQESVEDMAEERLASELDTLVEEQQKRIQELEEEVERLKDAQLRKTAEMENMRKRLQREREQVFQMSREAAVEAFLPVNDDLIRTLNALQDANAKAAYLDGIKLVAEKFEEVLKKHGVQRIDETGVPFDVDLHDAMLRQKPENESVESDTVLHVIENGYKIGEKTLRHAKVIVSE